MAIKNNVEKLLMAVSALVLIFTIAVQSSNDLIYWLNPEHVSTKDEKFLYTLIPSFFSLFVIGVMAIRLKKAETSRPMFMTLLALLMMNVALFIYYVYYQYFHFPGDWYLF